MSPMRISRILALLLLFASAAAFLPATAMAQAEMTDEERQRARELFENGAILYEEGQYEDAIVAWEEAYRLSEEPLLIYNIANALERLNRLEESLDKLNEYRVYAPADERETLERRIRNIEGRLEEQREQEAAQAELERLRQEQEQNAVAAEPEREPIPRGLAITRYTLMGVAGAGLTSGIVFGLRANSLGDDAEAACLDGSPLLCPESASSDIDSQKTAALLSDISFGIAGAAAVGAIVTYFVNTNGAESAPAEDEEATEPEAAEFNFRPLVGRSTAGVLFDARF